jgi:hypothetical protein
VAGTEGWGPDFDPERLARIELRAWKAYYRRQPARLFALLVLANREQAEVGWPRAILGAICLARAAAGFATATGDYDRYLPDIARGYRALGIAADRVDEVARRERRWWVVRREIGLATEVRDRGAAADADGPAGPGGACWPEVARILRDSYRSLGAGLDRAPAPS